MAMQVANLTKFPFGTKATSRGVRAPEIVVIVRGLYRLEHGKPLTPLEPAFEGDLLTQGSLTAELFAEDDPDRVGECLYPGDFADFKANAEVMLQGARCHPPPGATPGESFVALEVGVWKKLLRVFGIRAWSDTRSGAQMSAPRPFTSVPIDWKHAFGGATWPVNPVGKGLGPELPNVEDPLALIKSRSDRPVPASFGPINPAWPQRTRKLGKEYGKAWKATRSPWYSEDFDWSYFHAAPADQQLPDYLKGDEPIRFTNLHPHHQVLESRLPGTRIRAFVRCKGEQLREVAMKLDTLFVDLQAETVALTWRGLAPVRSDDLVDVETLLLASEQLGETLERQHYEGMVASFEADPLGLNATKGLAEERDAELARAEATFAAVAKLGSGGEEKLGAELAGVMRVSRGANDPAGADLQRHLEAGIAERRKQQPNAPDRSANLREAFSQPPKKPSPPALKVPSPGKPPQDPALAGKMQDLVERVRSSEKAEAEARANANLPPRPEPIAQKLEVMVAELGPRDRPPVEPGPGLDLSEQDYSGRDLRGRDLSSANLSAALLTGADLRGAKLCGADLSHAVLHQADLTGADLSGAKLLLTTMSEVKAHKAVFQGARLERTFLTDADLSEADLSDVDASFVILNNVALGGAVLARARITDSLVEASNLTRVDATGAELRSSLLLGCDLTEAKFNSALLAKAAFNKSSGQKASFRKAQGLGAIFLECTLDQADFTLAVLPSALFLQASAMGALFRGANLKEARFYRAVLDGADFSYANLFGADLRKAILNNTRFVGASLFEAILLGAAGRDADFSGANLNRAITGVA